MRVLFTSKLEGEITSFHPYSFEEVVEMTDDLDKKWKKKNAQPIHLDFMLSNEEGDKLYTGTYVVGEEDTTNIYDHICQKLVQLSMRNHQHETERDILLQQLTSHTPTNYQMDVTELVKKNTEKSSTWNLTSKHGKVLAISLVSLLVLAITISIALAVMVNGHAKSLNHANQELTEVRTMKEAYETALRGDQDAAVNHLKDKEELSDSEQKALVHILVVEKNYKEALKYADKKTASFLASQVMDIHGMDETKEFQESHPSPVGAFEVAFHTEEYEKAITVEKLPMSTELYKEKGLAYLRLDQLEEAKKMASEAKNDDLNEKINEYEELEEQMKKLNGQIETEKQSDNEDQDKIDALEGEKDEFKTQQNNI
ncbi:hypothetical protein LF817_14865 [Halobacillus sp. A1]|uniref:hypothetical protein n=1 Tax=Halobacillus sp. A1 TaxID=2880262 RepID=UPI0020A6BD0A|nr:hypothetical protein [Halobacillus sp. A1]MCP3032605.1 hypothetical protein [Halobacillus sp. A1]